VRVLLQIGEIGLQVLSREPCGADWLDNGFGSIHPVHGRIRTGGPVAAKPVTARIRDSAQFSGASTGIDGLANQFVASVIALHVANHEASTALARCF